MKKRWIIGSWQEKMEMCRSCYIKKSKIKNMLNKGLIILGISILFFASACKSKKKKAALPVVIERIKDSTKTNNEAENLLNNSLFYWTTFNAKMDVEFVSKNNKQQFDATIRMYKDSLIWVSASLFGFEGGRVLITRDSAVILNKLQKNYTVYKKEQLKNLLNVPLEIAQLQNLLLSQPVFPLKSFTLRNENDDNIIVFQENNFSVEHLYKKVALVLFKTIFSQKNAASSASVVYNNPVKYEEKTLNKGLVLETFGSENNIKINLNYNEIEFNNELSFPLSIPKNYEKL